MPNKIKSPQTLSEKLPEKTSAENEIAEKYLEVYDQRYSKVRENMLKIIENG